MVEENREEDWLGQLLMSQMPSRSWVWEDRRRSGIFAIERYLGHVVLSSIIDYKTAPFDRMEFVTFRRSSLVRAFLLNRTFLSLIKVMAFEADTFDFWRHL